MFIAIDGPIGVGKTTLAKKVAKSLKSGLVMEKVRETLLRDFYNTRPGADVTTQYDFLFARFKQQQKITASLSRGERVICDYTFAKNLIFSEINLEEEDQKVFQKYYDLFAGEISEPDLVVYLQGSLSSIQKRIKHRGRDYERKIKNSYLEEVLKAYQDHFFSKHPERLLIVNTDSINVADVKSDVDDLIRVILETPHGVNYYHPPGSVEDPDGVRS